jgi:pseudaminic acid biosynthesis-associated methylase
MTRQIQQWGAEFGRDYTDRNPQTAAAMDALYVENYGVSRTALNQEFLGALPRDLRILEVGCNVGAQLGAMAQMGFTRLAGVDIQPYALKTARQNYPGILFMAASALELPVREGAFDLVFTSGVLIHIHPDDLSRAMGEIYRACRRYIWGLEYFHPTCAMIPYRGQADLLWKGDYAGLYRERFPDLKLLQEQKLPYINKNNQDVMYLLEKTPA